MHRSASLHACCADSIDWNRRSSEIGPVISFNSLSLVPTQPQTDAAVPEAHRGLHTYLYGEEGAESAHASSSGSNGGTGATYVQFTRGTVHSVEEWLGRYDSSQEQPKVAGVYGVYDDFEGLVSAWMLEEPLWATMMRLVSVDCMRVLALDQARQHPFSNSTPPTTNTQ